MLFPQKELLRADVIRFEIETTCLGGNQFGFGAGVFSAVQRTNFVNLTTGFAVRAVIEETTDIRQFAAFAATDTLAPAIFADGQNGRYGPFCLGKPGIFIVISHRTDASSVS